LLSWTKVIQSFESKSQLSTAEHRTGDCCLGPKLFKVLKANHNVMASGASGLQLSLTKVIQKDKKQHRFDEFGRALSSRRASNGGYRLRSKW